MNTVEAINAGIIAVNGILEIITHLKAQAGLSDEELDLMFKAHGVATSAAIKGYLDNLPK